MRRFPLLLAGALLVAASGCASMRVSQERTRYLTTQLDGLHYARPMPEVWLEVQHLLAGNGYPLTGDDAAAAGQTEAFLQSIFSPAKETRIEPRGGRSVAFPDFARRKDAPADGPGKWFLETGWSDRAIRYRADGSTDGKTCQVTFTAIVQNPNEKGHDGERHRDLDMELDLARRVDPEAVARIEAGLEALAAKEGG